ncbi:MAG TPA: ribosome-associated translation inhibitor RaiA [Anaerolineae bacterium]|nr:ribosome-associated translation inhibitor RaiA [Anaerolineae bacterium]HOQ97533.1 ribosome-associated translation inhibitor RaiA [Anaerolineae bacterium]HPL27518.1 ribosome-associated translation inhibitor RaiA [Anaerolineae bacterium]
MGYQIVGIDMELTERVKQEVAEKIGKLDKFLTGIPEETILIRVALSKNQRNHRWTDALVDLAMPGDQMLARGEASTPEHAVHLAVIELERQLNEHKQRAKPYV